LEFLFSLLIFSQIDHFGFANISSPQTAGAPCSITVYAYDASNNIVTNFNEPARIYTTPGPQYGNLDIVFNNGVWQGQFTATLAGTYTISCQDYSNPPHTGESNQVTFNPNSPYKLLVILPGQTYTPGIDSGKTGSVVPQTAGDYFNVSVYLTDQWSNLISSGNDSCQMTSSDGFAPNTGFSLNNGTAAVSPVFRTAGSQHLYTRSITTPSLKPDTSSLITVYPGDYAALLVMLPGETYLPGDTETYTPGKLDLPEDQYELQDFEVTVYATDTMWNKTSTSGGQIQLLSDFLFSNPAPESLVNGEADFTINFSDTGRVILWAEDKSTSGVRSYNNYLNILAVVDTTVIPDSFLAYPNPMGIESHNMVFAYTLQSPSNLIFAIYDPFGNLVYRRDLAAGEEGARAGTNRLVWNGRNEKGKRVASGVYYVVLKAWTHTATIFNKKMKVGVVW